jgi:hypothetical protein
MLTTLKLAKITEILKEILSICKNYMFFYFFLYNEIKQNLLYGDYALPFSVSSD